ncbi:flagellar basal body protein FliL [Helicobacter valdiviensis]|uniref:Flagellar protein FliL n=1 Tax=Helicobacter valdiviensis TaxID=1458358 RepID=A0A2W6MWH4_9HELI|nr:flagellar basal body-associated protein FliL [Helicobacter valdiviensis]PZT48692.1 flagellar basal body protein FliL [Helicobacter valdiviensis]
MAEEVEEKKESKLASLKQNKMILFIIIGVVALLLIILIVVAILIFSGGDEQPQAQQQPQTTQQAGAQGGGGNLLSVGQMYPMDQFIVNLMTSGGGKRYLKASLALELSAPTLQTELDTKRDIVRDTVITVLSSKTLEEIQTTKGKQKLKEELLERINEFLVDGRVANIFFTDFVVQ